MRSGSKLPRNKRYFHTKPKIDKRDIAILKKKIQIINQKKKKKELEEQFSKSY